MRFRLTTQVGLMYQVIYGYIIGTSILSLSLYQISNIDCLIDLCFTPLSTHFQLYHGVSWVSYQWYWYIYPDISQSVVKLTPQPCAPRRAAITTIFKVLDPAGDRTSEFPQPRRTLYRYTTEEVISNIKRCQYFH